MSARDPKRARPAGLDALVTTFDLASLGGVICCMAVAPDGTRVVCTKSAIFAIAKAGRQTLIAGHRTKTGFADGQDSEARFNCPNGITVDGDGNLLVADTQNHALRKVTLNGAVSTLAGTVEAGFADGVGPAARFDYPCGIVVNAEGVIFVTDKKNHCVRQIGPGEGRVTTLVGAGKEKGFADGQRADARFNKPCGLALDVDGNLIVADINNSCIRKVTTVEGRVTTVAGCAGQHGFADGEGVAARFQGPHGLVVDGNNNILVADTCNHRIRMIAGANASVTTVSGSSEVGAVDGACARFTKPLVLAMDEGGRLLVHEFERSVMRVLQASLAPPLMLAPKVILLTQHPLEKDLSKLLEDTGLADVTFAVDGQRFPAHCCVLAARSPFFRAMFESGKGMHEEGSRAAGQDIVIKEVSAGAFRVLLRFLYTHKLPVEEDCGEGLEVGEMVRVADRFQAVALYKHCVEQFREWLTVNNVVARLVLAHDSGLAGLEEAAMEHFKTNALVFQVSCMRSAPQYTSVSYASVVLFCVCE